MMDKKMKDGEFECVCGGNCGCSGQVKYAGCECGEDCKCDEKCECEDCVCDKDCKCEHGNKKGECEDGVCVGPKNNKAKPSSEYHQ